MDKPRTTSFYRGRLPHWQVDDGAYFLTLRLAGTLPREVEQKLRGMRAAYLESPTEEKNRLEHLIMDRMEDWLNRLSDKRHLIEPAVARVVMDSIAFHHTNNVWEVYEYVVMPNHIHILFSLRQGSLRSTMIGFKRWTGSRATPLIPARPGEAFWQDEWFDHWIRSNEEFHEKLEYIRQNPVVAGLTKDYRDWPYASWAP
jgi:REP element-mobilizing transposase RayT